MAEGPEYRIEYRAPRPGEMEQVYLMGYDSWSAGADVHSYLSRCASEAHQDGRWFVLCAGDLPVSSLLVHSFDPWGSRLIRGLGSVATAPAERGRGYGHEIVRRAVGDVLLSRRPTIILLYSDIGPAFYESLGFTTLPSCYQTRQGSSLMALSAPAAPEAIFEQYRDRIPAYF